MRNDTSIQKQGQGSGQGGGSGQRVEQKANQAADKVAEKAQATVVNTREKIAGQLSVVARAIESAANTLEKSEQGGLAQKVRPYIQKVDDASERLRQKSPRELKSDVESTARDKPLWFLGGAFLIGLLGARFLKASDKDTNSQSVKGSVGYARA